MNLKYIIYRIFRSRDLKVQNSKDIAKINFNKKILLYFFATTIILFLFSCIGCLVRLDWMVEKYLSDFNVFDLLLGQISNTLIVLSLTTVLSEGFRKVYWVDIKEEKLIYPSVTCFTGITVYLLTGLGWSIIFYAASFYVGVMVSFLVSILLLVFLTLKMISIHFGREELKIKLANEYKRKYILTKMGIPDNSDSSEFELYDEDRISYFLERLQKLKDDCSKQSFSKKRKFMFMLRMEIEDIDTFLKSKGKQTNSKFSILNYLEPKQIKEFDEQLEKYDKKIEEYTRNAISKNDRDVIIENIKLLVECENCIILLHLFKDLLDWNEEYACRVLAEIDFIGYIYNSDNPDVVQQCRFLQQYAFHKLISSSDKFGAIPTLLLNYSMPYLEMTETEREELRKEKDETIENINQILNRLENEHDISEEVKKNLEERREELKEELRDILSKLGLLERRYHVPVEEAYVAYMEGKYKVANNIIDIIYRNFEEDKSFIFRSSGIMEIDGEMSFDFSYVTEEEIFYINKIMEKDADISVISESAKKKLKIIKEKVHLKNRIDSEEYAEIMGDTEACCDMDDI